MHTRRSPATALRPFVTTLWATRAESPGTAGARERVLPTGEAHVVFLLGEEPLRLHDGTAGESRRVGFAVVGGPRAGAYVKDVSRRGASVGAQLRPGAAAALFGVPASELAGRHSELRDVWGGRAEEAHERLAREADGEARLDLLERILMARLPRVHGLHPAVAQALERFASRGRVCEVVAETGYSHRRFNELFVGSVGLTPKVYCRLRRFQGVLARAAECPAVSWADLSHGAGYADQAHLTREFREFAGLSPGEWRRLAPAAPHHVPTAPPPP